MWILFFSILPNNSYSFSLFLSLFPSMTLRIVSLFLKNLSLYISQIVSLSLFSNPNICLFPSQTISLLSFLFTIFQIFCVCSTVLEYFLFLLSLTPTLIFFLSKHFLSVSKAFPFFPFTLNLLSFSIFLFCLCIF